MKAKIMVVDDEKVIRDMLAHFLKKKDYEVILASSAVECLEKLVSQDPQVILLDIRMPGLSGMEAIKKIKDVKPDVGIIMATAVMDEAVARESVKLGAVDYIIKPFDLSYLEKVLLVTLASLE